MPKMKALCLTVSKLWALIRIRLVENRSKVTVKVTCTKSMVPSERSCHVEHESPFSNVKTVIRNVKVF